MLAAVVLCVLPSAPPVYVGVAPRAPELDVVAERAAIALGEALERRGAVDLGSPPLPAVDDVVDPAIAAAVTAARARYQEGEFAAALEKASEAVSRFEAGGAFQIGPGWKSYAEAIVLRALSLRRLGREAEADDALVLLVTTQPDVPPDPGITPPKVTARYEQLKGELRAKPRVQIEVVSEPPGAEVVVDGRSVGVAPLVVRDLLPGTHFIGLSADGNRKDKRVVVTTGSARVAEQVGDPRLAVARGVQRAAASPPTPAALAKAARAAGDDVFVGALLQDAEGPVLLVARVSGERVVVAGARVESKGAVLKSRAEAISDALLRDEEGWAGPAVDGATPAALFFSAAGGDGAREDDGSAAVWIAVTVGAAVVVLAGAGAVAFVLQQNAARQLHVVVDASKL